MRRLFITRSTLILAFAIWFVERSFSSEPLTPVPKVSVNRVELKRSPHGSYITATCTFENPTNNEVKYTGYARNSFAPPLKPGSISPIYSVEYKSDGQWHECPIGWCGTGMARLGAKPGTTGVFDVILPASAWDWEAIRIGLRCSSSNSKEGTSTMVWSESVSHDGIVRLWRLKRIPDNSSATPGLIGRTTVGDKDIGLAVKYAMGKPLLNATIQEEVFRCGGELKNARITLTGVLHVPQATTVLAWHAGGSASRGIHWLDVDGRHVGSIGDDRVKDIVYRLPLKAGAYPVKWVLTGGDFGNSVLQFVDDRTKRILPVTAPAEAVSVATSPPLKRILDNSSAQPRSLPPCFAEDEPAAPAHHKKELTLETGDFTIHGTGFQPAVLKNDARAYGNRRYVWKDVPEKFAGCKFTKTNGGVRAKISVKAKRDAVLYVATATIQSGIDMTGWEDTGISFYYTDKGKTRMRVFRKSLKAAEQVVVPQGNWSGGVVIWDERVDTHRTIWAE